MNKEIEFFLDEAIKSAKEVGLASSLSPDYASLYNQTDLSGQRNEVLLWRMYSEDAKVQNQVLGATHGYGSIDVTTGTGENAKQTLTSLYTVTTPDLPAHWLIVI